jgi:hypothetical protein
LHVTSPALVSPLARLAVVALLVATVATLPATGRSAHFPVADVTPGMTGEGVTRLEGGRKAAFKAHLLGVLDNVIGPRRQVILARLEGANLEHTGVIAGMSGSPVYVDGRLLGAVAYSMGQFSKEPIAGITPIGEMLDAAGPGAPSAPRTVAALPFDLALSPERLVEEWRRTLRVDAAFHAGDAQSAALGLPTTGGRGLELTPIATPLTMSGFGPETSSWIGSLFGAAGFAPVSGQASQAGAASSNEPLQPGDAVGVSLVSGDLALGATGTVTHVDGPRVLAFGHPFFNLGPTRMPMTRAEVITVVPSLLNSIKLASLGPAIGVMNQDRATAIGGMLGPAPRTIPLRVSHDTGNGTPRTFTLNVADDQLFTPLLVFVSVANVLQSYQRELGVATIQVSGAARIGDAVLRFDDVYTGDSALVNASSSLAAPLSAILRSDLGAATIDGVDVAFRTDEQARTSRLGQSWLGNPRPRAGAAVRLHVETRTFRSGPTVHTLDVPVPAHAAGIPLQIRIVDGGALAQQEGRRRTIEQARSIPELVSLLNGSRRGDRWYVQLVRAARGTVVGGRDMPALPGTVLTVLDGTAPSTTLDQEVLGEWEIRADAVATGQRTLSFTPAAP